MASRKMKTQTSLQSSLSRWIIATSLGFVLIAGGIAGGMAFIQSQEYQDNTLEEIAHLLEHQQIKRVTHSFHHESEDETIIIQPLQKNSGHQLIPYSVKEGLQTINLNDESWRVFAFTRPNSQVRFAIAQKTEIRDNLARNSAMGVLLPIVTLVVLMLFLVRLIIHRLFLPLTQLTQLIAQQDGTLPKTLPLYHIPSEIIPFINAINSLISRIQQVIGRQKRFIADAAHELRTPITALSLQAENMSRAHSQEDRLIRQQQLHIGLNRLKILVVQLLDLARLQNTPDNNSQTVFFNDVIQEAMAELYPLAEESNIDIGMIKQDKIYIEGNQGKLLQLVKNAIENAIKYTLSGGKIDISLSLEQGEARFKVEDTGIGIPEDQLEKVLQPFYRIEESQQSGNGLGLAICQEIAQQLGGIITLSNRQYGGLCFTYKQKARLHQQ